jgi:hypothetical protein
LLRPELSTFVAMATCHLTAQPIRARSSLPREHHLELLVRILAPAQVRVLAFCSKIDHIAAIKAPEYAPFVRPPPRNRHYREWDGAG